MLADMRFSAGSVARAIAVRLVNAATVIPDDTWARSRGRVSSTEIADLIGVNVPYAGKLLTGMEEDGLLNSGRKSKIGRGFYYAPAEYGA